MSALTLSRWQFGVTTVYHFFFVPLTIGLIILVAVMETLWIRTNDESYLKLTKFFGKLFLINFAMGVATGLVQEFQFGMNWASYSRFVGDVFGAPLAAEGLLAFFMESTFLGLWMFGWDKLSRRVHLACVWMVVLGTNLSAIFILAANSWMQHPVGYTIDPKTHTAHMTNFFAVLGNSTLWFAYPHVLFASVMTGALFVLAIASWHLLRNKNIETFQKAAGLALAFLLIASIGTLFTGDSQAQVMTRQQPMKMAAAEALYHTQSGAPFSLFAIGTPNGSKLIFDLTVPHMLSVLATNTWNGTVLGIDNVQAQEARLYGPGNYIPIIPVAYWSFRLMVGIGFILAAYAIWGIILLRQGRINPKSKLFLKASFVMLALPFIANSFGWIFTEMGRQPWVVYGLLKTANGVSPNLSSPQVFASLIGFGVVYLSLAAVDMWLMLRLGKELEEEKKEESELPPLIAY
jgi:cytochrome d ubiquinol oxidase subunit I